MARNHSGQDSPEILPVGVVRDCVQAPAGGIGGAGKASFASCRAITTPRSVLSAPRRRTTSRRRFERWRRSFIRMWSEPRPVTPSARLQRQGSKRPAAPTRFSATSSNGASTTACKVLGPHMAGNQDSERGARSRDTHNGARRRRRQCGQQYHCQSNSAGRH